MADITTTYQSYLIRLRWDDSNSEPLITVLSVTEPRQEWHFACLSEFMEFLSLPESHPLKQLRQDDQMPPPSMRPQHRNAQ